MPTSEPIEARAERLAGLAPEALSRELLALEESDEDAPALLSTLLERVSDKARLKLVRRARHRLRSRGVRVDDLAREGRPSVLRPLDVAPDRALVSSLDPLGQRLLFLVEPRPGGARVVEAVLSDTSGVRRLRSYTGSRSAARNMLREIRAQGERGFAELAPGEARALLARAEAVRSETSSRREVDPELLGELLREPADETPGERVRRELASEAQALEPKQVDDALARDLEQRRLPLFAPPPEGLRAVAEELLGLSHSPLVLSEAQRLDREREVYRRAGAELLDEGTRGRFATRLEETAAIWLAGGDREGAARLVELAGRVREAQRPHEIPYLAACLSTWLSAIAERERPRKSGRLIVPR
jgi:hypothetical protein